MFCRGWTCSRSENQRGSDPVMLSRLTRSRTCCCCCCCCCSCTSHTVRMMMSHPDILTHRPETCRTPSDLIRRLNLLFTKPRPRPHCPITAESAIRVKLTALSWCLLNLIRNGDMKRVSWHVQSEALFPLQEVQSWVWPRIFHSVRAQRPTYQHLTAAVTSRLAALVSHYSYNKHTDSHAPLGVVVFYIKDLLRSSWELTELNERWMRFFLKAKSKQSV